jgi:hypothetical protein
MTPMTGMAEPESRTVVANIGGDALVMRNASNTVAGQYRTVTGPPDLLLPTWGISFDVAQATVVQSGYHVG